MQLQAGFGNTKKPAPEYSTAGAGIGLLFAQTEANALALRLVQLRKRRIT
jgi:hypothetical protein